MMLTEENFTRADQDQPTHQGVYVLLMKDINGFFYAYAEYWPSNKMFFVTSVKSRPAEIIAWCAVPAPNVIAEKLLL